MSCIWLNLLAALLDNLVEAAREEFWWDDTHFIHILYHLFDILPFFVLYRCFIIKNSLNTIVFVVVWVGCSEKYCVLFWALLVYSEDKVNPLVNVFSDILALELFSEDPCQVVRVHSVWWHHHLIDKQISFQASHFLLLGETSVESVSVLVHFWKKVVLWQ